jgi:dihydrofolate synthase/folylpolyglutamate synthase
MPNNLAEWLTHLESLNPKTIALGLERIADVKQRLNLQPYFPIVIVGGTNGKGSVCAMLESILHAAGYRVGCYTSPHLLEYNERVRVSKQSANDAELCAAFKKIEKVRGDIQLTYFEFGTLAAMQMFIEQKVDVAILEVGLGGRLDAVNIFDADCAVVTSIDIDHTDYLGDTREKIAFEKAGIFRAGKVAVFGDTDVPQAIRTQAEKMGAELWCLGSEFGFKLPSQAGVGESRGLERGSKVHVISVVRPLTPLKEQSAIRLGEQTTFAKALVISPGERGQKHEENGHKHGEEEHVHSEKSPMPGQWNFFSKLGNRSALPFPALRGYYQLNNASAALAALDVLKRKMPVSMEAVRRGLVEVTLPARFQMVPGKPALILDVAHNPHAARALAKAMAALPPSPKTYAVCAMLKDKDIAGVVDALKSQVDGWLVAGIDAPRGATADELGQVVDNANTAKSLRFPNATEALHQAYNLAGENDRIVAFGSFYTVAEVMRARGLRSA